MTPRFEKTTHEGIFKDVSSGVFYFRDTVHGKDFQSVWVDRSLKTKSIGAAKERASKIRSKILLGEIASNLRHTFNEAFDLTEKIQSTKAKGTYSQIKSQHKHLRPWFNIHCNYLDQFEKRYEEVWAEYKLHNLSQEKPRKLEHDRRYLVMALKRAQKRGWISKEFFKSDFDLNEVVDPIGKYIDSEQVNKLLLHAKATGPRIYLQILIALTMGMRKREILHLSKEEVDLERREINLDPKRLKTRKSREVAIPISHSVYPLLKRAFEEAPGKFVFPAWHTNEPGQPLDPNQPQNDNSFHWDKVRELAKVNARFHDLRHTALTNMLVAGFPEFAIRKICGVAEETMRRIYAHVEVETKDKFRDLFAGKFQETT